MRFFASIAILLFALTGLAQPGPTASLLTRTNGQIISPGLRQLQLTNNLKFSTTTDAGLLVNSLTTAQRDALTATNGAVILNSDTGKLNIGVNGVWQEIAGFTGSVGTTNDTFVLRLSTINDMLNTTVGSQTNGIIVAAGYNKPLDGGGGVFSWNPTNQLAADYGTRFQSAILSTGRWERIYSGDLMLDYFGAAGDAASNDTAAYNLAQNSGDPNASVVIALSPGKTYAGNFVTTRDGVTLKGGGGNRSPTGLSRLVAFDPASPAITVGASAATTYTRGFTLESVTLDVKSPGYDAGNTNTWGRTGLLITGGAQDVRVHDVVINEFRDDGLKISAGTTLGVTNVEVTASVIVMNNSSQRGVHLLDDQTTSVDGVSFFGGEWKGGTGGTVLTVNAVTFDTIGLKTSTGGAAMSSFSNSGAIRGTAATDHRFNVKWVGAKGDSNGTPGNGTDDTTALRAANTAAAAIGASLFYPAGTYRITGTITNTVNVYGTEARLLADANILALQIGDGTTVLSGKTFHLPKVEKATINWTNAPASGGTGISLKRLQTCYVHVPNISYFTVGLECNGTGGGFVHNDIHLGYLWTSKTNLVLTSDATGWCNDNNFHGGQLSLSSTITTNGNPEVVQMYVGGQVSKANNNRFWGTSMEGEIAKYFIWCEGQNNSWYSCRYEGTGPPIARFSGSFAKDNLIHHGYYAQQLIAEQEIAGVATNILGNRRYTDDYSQISVSSSGLVPAFYLHNASGSGSPVIDVLRYSADPLTNSTALLNTYTMRLSDTDSFYKANTDAGAQFKISHFNGTLFWGPADGTFDTDLFRAAADLLQTDDDFRARRVGVNTVANTTDIVNVREDFAGQRRALFGNYLNDPAAVFYVQVGSLDTSAFFTALNDSAVSPSGNFAGRGLLAAGSDAQGLVVSAYGSGQDVRFSAGSANIILTLTNDYAFVNTSEQIGNELRFGAVAGTYDTVLNRSGADTLRTPDAFVAETGIAAGASGLVPTTSGIGRFKKNQNATTRIEIENSIALGNPSAQANVQLLSVDSSGTLSIHPSDGTSPSSAVADRLALTAESTAAGLAIAAPNGGQDIRFFLGDYTEDARFSADGGLSLGSTVSPGAGGLLFNGAVMQGGDVADAGAVRLANAAAIGWEASPAGTDATLSVDSAEYLQLAGITGINLPSTALVRWASGNIDLQPVSSFNLATRTWTGAALVERMRVEGGANQSRLLYQTGTNTVQYAAGGTLTVNTTQVGNITIGEDNLMTYVVGAHVLSTDNSYLKITCSGSFAANANAKTVKAWFGATQIFTTGALLFNAADWVMDIEIIRTGAATQLCNAAFHSGSTLLSASAGVATAAETLSGAVTFKLTGEATATDDITQKTETIRWYPAN